MKNFIANVINDPRFKGVEEAVKEALRLALLLAVGTFLDALLQHYSALPQDNNFVIYFTLLIRFADKWYHENYKARTVAPPEGYAAKGLLPF